MFRYRLRTLLIVLAIAPPVLAGAWWAIRWVASDSSILAVVAASVAVLLALAVYIALTFLVGVIGARLSDAAIDMLERLVDRR